MLQQVRQLEVFDIGQSDSQQAHDNLQNAIVNYYNSSIPTLRPYLTYLRQEADKLSDTSKSELRDQQREAATAKKDYEELSKQLREQIATLNKEKRQIETKNGELASKVLGIYFEEEAENAKRESEVWFEERNKYFKYLFWLIFGNLATFLIILLIGDIFKFFPLRIKDIFTIQYGLVNFSLLSLFSYALVFASRNYSIRENIASVNRHRTNVAMTIDNFLKTNPSPEVTSEIIHQGTEVMFKHLPFGFVNKNDGAKDVSPIEIINPIQKFTNQQ